MAQPGQKQVKLTDLQPQQLASLKEQLEAEVTPPLTRSALSFTKVKQLSASRRSASRWWRCLERSIQQRR